MFQDYKQRFYEKCKVELTDDLDTGIEIDMAEIEPTSTGLRVTKKGVYGRTQMKKETKERIDEEYDRDT